MARIRFGLIVWLFVVFGSPDINAQETPPARETPPPVQETPPTARDVAGRSPTPELEVPDDVRLAMEDLNNALRSGSGRRIGQKFSIDAMFESLLERKLIPPLEEAKHAEIRTRMDAAMRSKYRSFAELAWTNVKWIRFERLDEQRVVLLGRHYAEDELSTSVRWWLKLEDDQWSVYDLEILDLNLRFSTMAGAGFSIGAKRPESLGAFQELTNVAELLNTGVLDEEGLENLVDNADLVLDDEFPTDIKRFVLLLRALALAQLDDATGALADLAALEKMPGESPILYRLRGEILAEREQYAAAIESFKKLGEGLGFDVSVHESLSDTFLAWGKFDQAAEHARLGLQDMPESYGCLASLAAALPSSKVAELEPFFKDHDYDENVLATVIMWCAEFDRMAGAKFAYQALKKHHPNSDLVEEWREDLDSADQETDAQPAPNGDLSGFSRPELPNRQRNLGLAVKFVTKQRSISGRLRG